MKPFAEAELWVQIIVLVPLAAYLVAAAVLDARSSMQNEEGVGRIPNKLSYSSVLAGLVCHTVAFGLDGLWAGLLAVVITFVIGLFLVAFRLLGGGDVKLLMGVGAFTGLSGLGAILFYAVLAGSALGLLRALFTGYLVTMLVRMFRFVRGLFRMLIYKTSLVREELETDRRSMMPFAVPILAGAILAYTEAAFGWPRLLAWFLRPFVQ